MKTYLVTGAAGFIGSSLSKRLIELGNEVVTIDNLSTGSIESIPNKVKFIQGDCGDEKTVMRLSNLNFDAIFHIAGQSSGEISFDDPVYDLQTNAQSTLLLLKLALKIKCRKFIYASTMSVYGDQTDEPVSTSLKCTPKSFYGVGKLASENYLNIYQNFGVDCTALRLFNVYGPGQNMKNMKQGMVSIFITQALDDKHILVKGSKDRFRDFVYIDDVVNAFLLADKRSSEKFDIFNIATNKKTTIEKLLNLINKILNNKITFEFRGSTPGDQYGIVGNIDETLISLNWKPKISLESGLGRMIDWAQKID